MSQLEIELKQLKTEVINMWNLVHSQLVKSNIAMVNFDKNLAREVVSREKRVNGSELKIDRDCENIFALLTPVAVDLRFVLAVLKINSNLERIGDIAEGVAKYILSADKPFNPELLKMTDTIAMYDEAINILEDTLSSFENEDTGLARSVFQKDEFLDKINIAAPEATVNYLLIHPEDCYQALINLSIIRRLERVGDQSKNIAEETIFYVEAKVLKHGESGGNLKI
jgi:phosphate transport system protein